ncbi:MAG: hypothetical protein E7616_01795 [Ruminococcaceae bacterium]|nr:hypothetical protein [Oscillospiraceae bacterium]
MDNCAYIRENRIMETIIRWILSHNIVIFAVLIFIAIIFWLLRFENKLKINIPEASLVSLLHVVIGWTCMRFLAIVEAGFDLEKAANIRLYGAIFALPFLYYAWAKKTNRSIPLVMDISAICVICGAIGGRFNCLTKGCCDGIPFFFNEAYRWPLRQIELAFYAIFIIYYFRKIGTAKTYGQVYPIYLISYGLLRFICEFVRKEYTTQIGIFHIAQIWSLIAIAVGVVWLYEVNKKYHSGVIHRKLSNHDK